MIYRFSHFELDAAMHELRSKGEAIPLQPRVLALLFYFVERPDRAITKSKLLAEVWGGARVVEAALTRAISVLRSALGDTDRERRVIVTVSGFGYRFAATVESVADEAASASTLSAASDPRLSAQAARRAVLDRPALVVLPFTQLDAANGEANYLADGITQDLTTALSCWKRFPVIGRRSAFAYRGSTLGIRQIADALEARYVLEGTVRRSGDRIRIGAELSDAENEHPLWSERFERPIGDVFALQDEICEQIVRGIEPELARAEIDRASRKPPGSLDAWDLELQATSHLYDGAPGSIERAGELIERALSLEPTCPHGNSLMALYHFEMGLMVGMSDPAGALASALDAARRACQYDPRDWLAHALHGIASLWVERDHQKATALVERSLILNPSGARAYQFIGCVYEFSGRTAEAVEALEVALRLDPQLQSQALVLSDLALCHLLLGEHEEARRFCQEALRYQPENGRALQRLVSTLGHLEDLEGARQALDRLRIVQPGLDRDHLDITYPFLRDSDREHFYAGLSKAGVDWLPHP